MKKLHVLAISSFAVHGAASLKVFTRILGSDLLPVPTLLLNGLTNMSMVRKFDLPFQDLLQGTFELVADRNLRIVLYIGYLGKAEQAGQILELAETYSDYIEAILCDPVCGDHGRAYVPDSIIEAWPALISKADLVFPNSTEIRLLTGQEAADQRNDAELIERFKKTYPSTSFVVTSRGREEGAETGFELHEPGRVHSFFHPVLKRNYGGSGDAFVAFFIRNHYYLNMPLDAALERAANEVYRSIERSMLVDSTDILINL